jgi:hypothetical protein
MTSKYGKDFEQQQQEFTMKLLSSDEIHQQQQKHNKETITKQLKDLKETATFRSVLTKISPYKLHNKKKRIHKS